MTYSLLRLTSASLFACTILTAPATALAQERAAPKYKFNLPPSADLTYAINAKQGGLTINGETVVQWNAARDKYTIVAETRAMLVGKILDEKSEGAVDGYGLAPVQFTEKRFRKEPTTASFKRPGNISFSSSDKTYPIKGGEQDRTSAIWQLISVARGAPPKFKPGSSWTFFVAGQHDAEPWTFKVIKQEKIRAPQGEVSALHIVKIPPPDAKSQKVDIWLAPSLEWYPVKLRFTDADGEYIEQSLQKISKK